MDEAINYSAVIAQLQLENEMLRQHMRAWTDARDIVFKFPGFLEELYKKLSANKYAVLIGLMIIYWSVSLALMIYDRLR